MPAPLRSLRRPPFELPYSDLFHALTPLLDEQSAPIRPSDPDRFLEALAFHKLLGFAAAALESGRLELASDPARRLRTAHAVDVLHASLLRRELPAIVQALERESTTSPILIKGPALTDRYYPDRRLRPFVDLDFLLRPDQIDGAVSRLQSLGYAVQDHPWHPFPHHVPLLRPARPKALLVELHWRLSDDRAANALDHASLISGAVALEDRVLVPATADQLLVVAVHLLRHEAQSLLWIRDLAGVATAASDDEWLEAFANADRLGLGWILHRALDYASYHLGFERRRPVARGAPPAWGPIRVREYFDFRYAMLIGVWAGADWETRRRYAWFQLRTSVPRRASRAIEATRKLVGSTPLR